MVVMADCDSEDSPQRLIAVSLGKIAACRGQRGGPTLRKSLLISTILHKARNTMMMENYNVMMESRRAELESEEVCERVVEPEEIEDSECVETDMEAAGCPAATRVWPVAGQDEPEYTDLDKENSQPTYIALKTVSTQSATDNLLQERDTNIEISCAKCTTKRRLTDCYEEDSENNNNNCDSKRLRLDSECSLDDSDNVQCDSPCPSQISSLVHRFNSGLSGFLGGHVTSCSPGDENTEQILQQNVSSCATQVTKELGALSRTCIALSV